MKPATDTNRDEKLQSKPTAGEWVQTGTEIRHKERSIVIANIYPHLESNMSKSEQLANAKHIVKCVNMHEELRNALLVASAHISYGHEALQNKIAELLNQSKA